MINSLKLDGFLPQMSILQANLKQSSPKFLAALLCSKRCCEFRFLHLAQLWSAECWSNEPWPTDILSTWFRIRGLRGPYYSFGPITQWNSQRQVAAVSAKARVVPPASQPTIGIASAMPPRVEQMARFIKKKVAWRRFPSQISCFALTTRSWLARLYEEDGASESSLPFL